ncbi:MAG: NUDIX domain-containing protein [Bacteroidales bacterium]
MVEKNALKGEPLRDTKERNFFDIDYIPSIKNIIDPLLTSASKTNNIHIQGNINAIFQKISQYYSVIHAGGGAVFSENRALLMIYRRGYWDLPKGKAETGERIQTTAQREVMEETGIDKPEIIRQLSNSYHMYPIKNQWVLKCTHWFLMSGKKQALKPQTSEDIDQAIWVPYEQIPAKANRTYASLQPIIRESML